MKASSKLIFILLFLLVTVVAFAQANDTAPEDDAEFNIFLLALATIFACAIIGAAIIGAIAATLVLFVIFGMISIGILSTSVAIGLYKRSFSAGFRSFFVILFGAGCALIGGMGVFLVDYFFELTLSASSSFLVGIVGGLIGGILMAIATMQVFQWLIKILSRKFQAS